MWLKNLIDSINNAKHPFDRILLRTILILIVITLIFGIILIGYSLLKGKHIRVASKDYGIDESLNITKPDSVKTLANKKTFDLPVANENTLKKSFPIKSLNTIKKPTTIHAKNVLNGNVSGGNVQIGDNNVIKREQRTLDDNLKLRLIAKVDSVIAINHLLKTIKITLSYPMNSEEAERYAIEIGNFLISKGYHAQNVNPSLWNEQLGFVVRYVTEIIQIEVGLKDIGDGKL